MRSEAVASSRIEGLSVSAKRLMEHEALEEIGVRARLDSTEAAVLANIRAMHDHVFSVGPGGPVTLETLQRVDADLLKGGPLEGMGGIVRAEQNWMPAAPPSTPSAPPTCRPRRRTCRDCSTTSSASATHPRCPRWQSRDRPRAVRDRPPLRGRQRPHGPRARADGAALRRAGGRGGASHLHGGGLGPRDVYRGAHVDALRGPNRLRRAQDRYVAYWCGACADACALAASFEERVAELRASWEQRVRPARGRPPSCFSPCCRHPRGEHAVPAARLTGRSREAAQRHRRAGGGRRSGVQNARNRKSNIFCADEVLDMFTLFERAGVTRGHDTAAARPGRAVPQRPERKGRP